MPERRTYTAFVDLPLTRCVGGPLADIDARPLPPFAPDVLAGLAALSRRLLADPQLRRYPDLAAFAYWCRPAHLQQLATAHADGHQRLGRGLALHIAPANVPINFAFSLAFGMLAGTANIVRVPETAAPQVDLVCDALAAVLADPTHARIAAMNRVVGYPRDDDITRVLSAHCQARLLWGGDATIQHLRTLPVPARCVEVAFADRYSLCLLQARAVKMASPEALQRLAEGFYNDAYLLDQNACSSPHLVIWQGLPEEATAAQARFWPALEAVVRQKYPLAPIQAVDKFVDLCRLSATLPEACGSVRHGNLIHRIRLASLPPDLAHHRGRHGLFFEYVGTDLNGLRAIVDERYQTLTSFGFDREALARQIVAWGLRGIDRVVPVGQALDIGLLWDGYDLIASLSRIVASP